jgi:hypothetical protein
MEALEKKGVPISPKLLDGNAFLKPLPSYKHLKNYI